MTIKLEINLTDKWLYSLIAFGVLIALTVGVYAYTSSLPNPGHGADKVLVSISTGEASIQSALDTGLPRKDCVWRLVDQVTKPHQWTCNPNEFVAGIGYEAVEWEALSDQHTYPEVDQLYCCKIG